MGENGEFFLGVVRGVWDRDGARDDHEDFALRCMDGSPPVNGLALPSALLRGVGVEGKKIVCSLFGVVILGVFATPFGDYCWEGGLGVRVVSSAASSSSV